MTFVDHTQLGTLKAVGLLWTSDQPDAEPSTCQYRTLIRERYLCPGGIRIHNPRRRAFADPRLRPRGHRDWRCYCAEQSN